MLSGPCLTPSLLAVPPVPLTAPRLLAKQSRQLVVSPLVSFSGDGPIASVRLHYRPQDSTMAWSTIVGEQGENRGWRWGCLGKDGMSGSDEGKGGMEGGRSVWRREGLKGEWWLLEGVGTESCVLHTLPPVDPSENVTL